MKTITYNGAMKKAISFFSSLKLGNLEKIVLFTDWHEGCPSGRYETVTYEISFSTIYEKEIIGYLTVSPYGCLLLDEDNNSIATDIR